MLCIQFPIGEKKHAIRSRRLHGDEIVTACTAGNTTEMVLICLYVGLPKHVLHELLAFEVPSAASIFAQNEAKCDAKKWKFHFGAMR